VEGGNAMKELLLTRRGDFYEAINDDARVIAKECFLTLTGKTDNATSERIPVVGIPYHTVDRYIKALAEKGYKTITY
jgi:DNA mismatch repair protein MutS